VTVLLDAYALIAYMNDEPAAPVVRSLLWKNDVAMSAVQVAEVIDRMERLHGVPADEVELVVSALGIEILVADYPVGAEAGRIRARRYVSSGRTLSLADSLCAATAVLGELIVATADPVLLDVSEAEGCAVLRLPPR